MKSVSLLNGLFWTGVLDRDLKVFDIIMETEFGTTYNSYVVKGSAHTALIETAKKKFEQTYFESVEEVCDPASVSYLIVNHTEPDHSGSIERLLTLNPNLTIVGSAAALTFLKHILNRDFNAKSVKSGDRLSLGDKTLRFELLPNLHWPDTMFTYLEEDQVLFPCDSFGAHYAMDTLLRSDITDEAGYQRALKYYFDNILGPFREKFVPPALAFVRSVPLKMICPGHGPVLDGGLPALFDQYEQWCQIPNPNARKTVVIPYVSAYGYTAQLGEHIARGIMASGDIDVRRYDLVEVDQATVLADIEHADGLLLGSPTILGDALQPIWALTTHLLPPLHGGKLAGAFGSYGWSGEGVPNLTERLRQLKMKVVDGLRVRFKPSEEELQAAYDFGYAFGCTLQGKENDR